MNLLLTSAERFCKKIILSSLLVITACSQISISKNDNQNLKEQRLATDFTDEGIKVYYTLFGKLEKIEVYGQADAWKGNFETFAEADALAKLVKFIYGNDVSTERRVKIISKAIEDAEDLSKKNSVPASDLIITSDKQLEEKIKQEEGNHRNSESSTKKAKILNESISDTLITITAKGKLVGVRKVNDFKRNDGKIYVAVYQWSEKDLATAESVRDHMNKK